jgi:hypothetical protein
VPRLAFAAGHQAIRLNSTEQRASLSEWRARHVLNADEKTGRPPAASCRPVGLTVQLSACASNHLFLSRGTRDKLADPRLNVSIDERIVQVLWVLGLGVMNYDAGASHSGTDPPNHYRRPRIG